MPADGGTQDAPISKSGRHSIYGFSIKALTGSDWRCGT
jgi:hypothetical protein